MTRRFLQGSLLILTLFVSACSHHGAHKPSHPHKHKKGIFSQEKEDDGDGPPESDIDVTHIPNATPKVEPLSRYGNPNKYEVFGKHYYTMPHSKGYAAEGTASWYGRKFHGQRTSSGEPYDMYGMTAAHRSLPLPTYAKVENLHNGKHVIVKINDRGPFVKGRLIDLSYAAAKKLGIHASGTGKVRITAIDPVHWHKQQKEHTRLAKADTKSAKHKSAKASNAKPAAKPIQLAQADKAKAGPTQKPATKPKQGTATNSTKPKPKSKAVQTANTDKQIYIQLGAFSKKDNAQKLADRATTLTQALNNVDVRVLDSKATNKSSYKVRIGPLKDEKQAASLKKRLVALNGASPKVIYE
ncbi:MAG: septal ring lytic transglycosylase RlpA family protein [Proteobacteria bacterium]|nr:septal ring lytic transglycosylase RlpA family protein [Pseudomonadota bacterium]